MAQAMSNPNTIAALTVPGTEQFLQENRIHVAGGSVFIDPYLVVHPREMAPGGEAKLRAKLELTYGLNNPSFYESPERLPIALNLASLLPISLESKRSSLMREIEIFNNETRTRTDTDLARDAADRAQPFAAIVRDTLNEPAADPVGMEMLKNGLSFYLLLRESLTRNGYLGRLNDYVRFNQTPDQILTSLQDKIGVPSETLIEAARTGGLKGIAGALGIEDAYLRETQELVERSGKREFSYNMVEHWHIGRQLLKDRANTTIDDKIAVGFERRIMDTMTQLRAKAKGQTDVPEGIKGKERWVAESLGMLPPIQRQLLGMLGYEICYTDEPTADKIAFYPHVYGLHRTTKDGLNDIRGTYRIYFGSKGDPEGARRTLVHEVTHNLWPGLFSQKEVGEIDKLANMDRTRIKTIAKTLRGQFDTFKSYMDDYHNTADPAQKQAVLARANAHFKSTLGPLDALFAENNNPYEVLDMAEHADQRLHIDGLLYKQSGYHGPQERFREVISRYAELRYVRLRNEPALMGFIAPNLAKVYDNYYLPHLERLNQKMTNGQIARQAPGGIAADALAAKEEPKPLPQPEETLPQPKRRDDVANDPTEPKRRDIPGDNEKPQPTSAPRAAAERDDTQGNRTSPSPVIEARSAELVSALNTLDRMGIHAGRA